MKTAYSKTGFVMISVICTALLSAIAVACPFCDAPTQTLSEETAAADAVVLAKLLKEAPASSDPNDPNVGAATFEVIEVLRGQEAIGGAKEIEAVYFGEADKERVAKDAAQHRRFAGFAYQLEEMAVCEHWANGPADPSLKEPIKSPIPTLVLSGEVDPITPTEFAEVAVSRLDNGHLTTVLGRGHSLLTTSECAMKTAAAFLKKPTAAVKDKCWD